MNTKPRAIHGVYYWPDYAGARDYANSVGVELFEHPQCPRAVRFTRGWAIQLRLSGPYLGPQHVAISTAEKT